MARNQNYGINMNTTNLVSTPNITGNIGSCEIKSTDISVSSFYTKTVAVNSCSGEVISQNTYYSYETLALFILIGIFGLLLLIWIFSLFTDY